MSITPAPAQIQPPAAPELDAATGGRYRRHGERLLGALQSLYGQHPQFPAARARLLETMARATAQRPPALRALDKDRDARPGWFTGPGMTGYCAYVDRFGGTLAGVAGRIGHLQDLGITYLHLLPFLRARAGENDGGFAVSDFDAVEPALGTIDDLDALTARLRGAGISLVADLVLNHVADDHAWAVAARAGDPVARGYFHVVPDPATVQSLEAALGEVFPGTAPGNFTHVTQMGGWVWTTFYPFQWDLNYANPAVFVEIAAALLRLANRGVEVFRLDSAPFLWKQAGTDCRNRPEVHTVLEALRAVTDICAPGVLLKAEAIVPVRDVGPYLDAGRRAPQCHIAYHSGLMAAAWVALARQDCTLLRETIAETPALPPASTWLTYVRCHDDIVWGVLQPADPARQTAVAEVVAPAVAFLQGQAPGSYARGVGSFVNRPGALPHGTNGMTAALTGLASATTPAERDRALRRTILLYGLAMAFGGIPLIYMGDELGQGNETVQPSLASSRTDARWVQRPFLDEERFDLRHDPASPGGAVCATLVRWLALRRTLPALGAGVPAVALPASHAAVLMLARGDDFLALFNFSERELFIDLPGPGPWRDLDDAVPCGRALLLGPWQMRWLGR